MGLVGLDNLYEYILKTIYKLHYNTLKVTSFLNYQWDKLHHYWSITGLIVFYAGGHICLRHLLEVLYNCVSICFWNLTHLTKCEDKLECNKKLYDWYMIHHRK